jgi:hypothetical protein
LTESSKTWKKKASSSTSSSKTTDVSPRVLEKHERILEVIDRVGRETVILCKKKVPIQQHMSLSTLIDKNIQNWENCDRTFLVKIYNISPLQKHTAFRTPANSTAINVITHLMTKIRMTGMPNDYGLVEETDLNGNNNNNNSVTTNTIRRLPIKRRLLADDEKIYGIQRLWTSNNSKFVLVKKAEFTETNSSTPFSDKFLLRSLTRQKSIDRDSREDIHLEHQAKQRANLGTNSANANGAHLNNNPISRVTLSPTPPISKSHHHNNKRSLKTILSTIKS